MEQARTKPTIIVVDDEEHALVSMNAALMLAGYKNVILKQDPRSIQETFEQNDISLLLLDLIMPHVSGEEVLDWVQANYPDVPVVITTAVNEIETAVNCMYKGAFYYLIKPVDQDQLVAIVSRAFEHREMINYNQRLGREVLSEELRRPQAFSAVITANSEMYGIFKYIEAVAPSGFPVLITGETGTGKELIAETIHRLSDREGAYVPVNIAGLDDSLLSDTLFGHSKGAYTGAERERRGMLETAEGGTILLDEIGDLSIESQIKLLRLLQERRYYPLGQDSPVSTDARFIFSTNRNLDERIRDGGIRKDFYYRLMAHHIEIPPLRKRREDIPLLVDHFTEAAAKEIGRKAPVRPPELYDILETYPFPGNVRELEGMVKDAVVRTSGNRLNLASIKDYIFQGSAGSAQASSQDPVRETAANAAGLGTQEETAQGNADTRRMNPFRDVERLPRISEATEELIEEALRRCKGNKANAARMLGISRQALHSRLRSRQDKRVPD